MISHCFKSGVLSALKVRVQKHFVFLVLIFVFELATLPAARCQEDLGFELVAEDFYKVFFRNLEIGEFDVEALRFRPVQVLRGSVGFGSRDPNENLRSSRKYVLLRRR
jgi:hypothetical protein